MSIKRFTKAFEKATLHNSQSEKKKSFQITYKKLNGRTVKRKIDPGTIKNGIVIAYDHKRKAIRSFKIDRVKDMKKIAVEYYPRILSEAEKKQIRNEMKKDKINPENHIKYLNERERLGNKRRNFGYLGALGLGVGSMIPKNKWLKAGLMAGAGMSGMLGYAGELDGLSASTARNFVEQAHEKKAFLLGFTKQAENFAHGAELAGLGILAAPSVKKIVTGKSMSEKNQHRAELAGLGVLAAPSVAHFAKGFMNKAKKAV